MYARSWQSQSMDGWKKKGRRSLLLEERRKGPLCSIYLWNPCNQAAKRDIRSWQRRYTERIEDWIYIYIYRIQGGIATSETMGRHKFIIFSETYLIRYLFISISKKKWRDKFSGRARNLKLIISQIYLNLGKINFSFFFFLIHP